MDRSSVESRPDPDALLARLQAEEGVARRGRLKLFFGATAGVGKTFAMLQEAGERKVAGADVVAGYVETHKRPETQALLEGLEELPPRWVEYRGVRLREFDLDAALARKPRLILVDELAHSNAEGLRHSKRWQDVVELLDAGIDVYTTVNVQHIESLNDVVAQITGVVVRETIPDTIIDRADEIELIDLPPDDLLQRLKEGKVYLPEQAQHALEKFFRKETLIALRELALRKTADRVNAQVQLEKASQAIRQPWATAERLLVCVGPSPLSARVVRVARRMAAAHRCEWLAVCVETPAFSPAARDAVRRNLRLAEGLGATPITLTGENVAEEIIAFARRRNVTKIVIGKPARPRWREWLSRSVVDQLIRLSGEIEVHVVKGESEGEREGPAGPTAARPLDWRPYAWALLVMAACTGVAFVLFPVFSAVNLTMIYLVGVVFVATRFGGGPSIVAALIAPLAFNFFFTEPYYSFAIRDAQYVVAFVALLVTAQVVSGLTRRVRRQSEGVRTRYYRTMALYLMSRQLAAAADRGAVIRVAAQHVGDVFGGDAVILTPNAAGSLNPVEIAPQWFRATPNEFAAAHWVFDHQQAAGRGTDTLPSSQGFYLPLVASGRPLGVLGVSQGKRLDLLEPDQRHMLETFATQIAIALERAAFAEQAEHARAAAESEQLRNSLLSCVSHDLRTPLAAITGSASALLDDAGRLAADARRELTQSIYDEGLRMSHLVGKLLDMTRLEAPGMRLSREWFPLQELVGSALSRLDEALRRHKVETAIDPELPLIHVDGVLVTELLVNLLENAARYTPPASTIRIAAQPSAGRVRVEILDQGPGLEPGMEEQVFSKFVRQRPPADRTGAGLGLAICRAIVQLHGGEIGAANRPNGGACFWFSLPSEEQPPSVDLAPLVESPERFLSEPPTAVGGRGGDRR